MGLADTLHMRNYPAEPACTWDVLGAKGNDYKKRFPSFWKKAPVMFAFDDVRDIFDYLEDEEQMREALNPKSSPASIWEYSVTPIPPARCCLERVYDTESHEINSGRLASHALFYAGSLDFSERNRWCTCQVERFTPPHFLQTNSWYTVFANEIRKDIINRNSRAGASVVQGSMKYPNYVTPFTTIPYHTADIFFGTPISWAFAITAAEDQLDNSGSSKLSCIKDIVFDALVINEDRAYAFELIDDSLEHVSINLDGGIEKNSWNAKVAEEASRALGQNVTAKDVQYARFMYRSLQRDFKKIICDEFGINLRCIEDHSALRRQEFYRIHEIVYQCLSEIFNRPNDYDDFD